MKLETTTNDAGELVVIRIEEGKDPKELGTVENGDFKAHAPAYYKEPLISEIRKLIGEKAVENLDEGDKSTEEELSEEADEEELLKLEETIERLKDENGALRQENDSLRKQLTSNETNASRPASETAPRAKNHDPIDYSDAPEMDPMQGDRTPAFAAWLWEKHPQEAKSRGISRPKHKDTPAKA